MLRSRVFETRLGVKKTPPCGLLAVGQQKARYSDLDVGFEGPPAAVGELEDHGADGTALASLHVHLHVELQLLGLCWL